GTKVKVTNLANNKAIIVRINDRGPFVRGRIIDLSRAAARKLGIIHRGVAHVTVEVVSPDTQITGKLIDTRKKKLEEIREILALELMKPEQVDSLRSALAKEIDFKKTKSHSLRSQLSLEISS